MSDYGCQDQLTLACFPCERIRKSAIFAANVQTRSFPVGTRAHFAVQGRDDDRTLSAKVVSGLRLGGGLVAGFLVVALALAAASSLPAGAPAFGQYALLASWGMLALATIVMFWTADRWAPYLPAFFVFPAVFKSLAVILIGPNPHSSISSNWLTRLDATELLAYCVVVIALT